MREMGQAMNRAAVFGMLMLLAVQPALGQDIRPVQLGDRVRITPKSRIARDRPNGRVVALEPDRLTIREADDDERSFRRTEIERIDVSAGRERLTSSGAAYGLIAAIPAAVLLVAAAPVENEGRGALLVFGGLVLVGGAALGQVLLSGENEVWVEGTWPPEGESSLGRPGEEAAEP